MIDCSHTTVLFVNHGNLDMLRKRCLTITVLHAVAVPRHVEQTPTLEPSFFVAGVLCFVCIFFEMNEIGDRP